ncbi:MAG: alanyl-tRNA editing protein [Butyrivibrio sp.]|nr:alanyl-tRNA editing protein [Butyrivibrio sp.]
MGKTVELYYENAYINEFDAEVLSCKEAGDGKYEAVLDKTAFFPEQGGQTSDTGKLVTEGGESASVLYTGIRKCEETGEDEIYHVLDKCIDAGTSIKGTIDWEHRFSNMQQHTGEHIFSGIVNSEFGYDNVGFHLSDTEVTMDYNGVLSSEDVARIEKLVNEAIWKNVRVVAAFPSEEELKEIDYRSKKELTGAIRIVTIEGYDICACCAPHVERTGEVGFLKVVGVHNYKGGVRVNILCGKRAFEFLTEEHDIISGLAAGFSTSFDKVVASVDKLKDDNAALKADLLTEREKLLGYELSGIDKSLKNVFLFKSADTDTNLMRKTVNKLAEDHEGFCGIFAGDDKTGYRYIVASGNAGGDARHVAQLLREKFGAKGGGSEQMVQGSLSGALQKDIADCCNNL